MKTSSFFPSRYLRASDLQGQRVEVTVEEVLKEDVGGKKQPVVRFKNKTKALVLNKTNLRTLEEIAGTETDDWRGLRIILYPTRVDYQGQRVDAIRIDRAADGGNDGREGDDDDLGF